MQQPLPAEPLLHGFSPTLAQTKTAAIYEATGRLRNLKAEYNVASRRDVTFIVKNATPWLAAESDVLAQLSGAAEIRIDDSYEAPKGTPAAVTPIGECYLPLDGLIDIPAERIRLTREIEKIEKEILKCDAKLASPTFVDRAPAEVVAQEKQRLEDWKTKLSQFRDMRDSLG